MPPAALSMTQWIEPRTLRMTRSVVYVAGAPENAVRRAPAASDSAQQNLARSDDTMFADAPFGVVRLDGEGVETAVMLDANRALLDMTEGRA